MTIPRDRASVVMNGSRTAICLGRGRKWWGVIERRSKKLTIQWVSDKDMDAYRATQEHHIESAIRNFLAHPGGLTDTARSKLEKELSDLQKQPVEAAFTLDREQTIRDLHDFGKRYIFQGGSEFARALAALIEKGE